MITGKFCAQAWLVAFSLVLAAAVSRAQDRAPESDFPIFGVAAGQVFRFGVASVEDPNRSGETDDRCQATLSFRDIQNRPIGTSLEVDLGPNEAAFHDLDTRTLRLSARQRISFRPVLAPSARSGPCGASFSVLNAFTGRLLTHPSIAVSKTVLGSLPPTCGDFFNIPLPDPTLLFLGFGQTLLYTVVCSTVPVDVNNMPLPCDVIVEIREGGPATPVVASLTTGPLMPGEAATLSLNGNTLASFGETAFLLQQVLSSPVDIIVDGLTCPATTRHGCKISVQVIDNLSAWTSVIILPP